MTSVPGRDRFSTEDPTRSYLAARLDLITRRMAATTEGVPADGADEQLDEIEAAADAVEEEGGVVALREVQRSFGLSPLEIDALLIALAADLSADARRVCAAYHGVPDAVRPSIGLALEVLGLTIDPAAASAIFGEARALVRHHLIALGGFDRPLSTRTYSVPDRVARALWGSTEIDPLLRSLRAPLVGVASEAASEVAAAVRAGVRTVYLREHAGTSGLAFAAAVVDELEVAALAVDLRRAGSDQSAYGLTAAAAREAGLTDAALVIGPLEVVTSKDLEALVPLLECRWPVLMFGSAAWDPTWSTMVPLTADAPRPDPAAVFQLWQSTLDARGAELTADAAAVASVLRLAPDQTVRAAIAAHLASASDGAPIGAEHVRAGARSQSAGRLETLAERVEPSCSFDDLVLAPLLLDQVRQVVERGRHRDLVLDQWGMGGPGSRGRGITALFAGDSGTGKTLSAEAIAGELGVDLYVIDLSTVVDKYIGETEKNLGRVFDEAEGINGVLFFDEADAIFGKRTETSDARDRYANVEVAYLLQRMERFDGVAILATNLRSNIDEAFTRRLDIIVHFTLPDVEHRRLLWARHLPDSLPQSGDLDLDVLASRFEISGGVIRNVALTAAYRAAQRGDEVTMGDLVRAMNAEYTKMGRLFDTSGLGDHARVLDDPELLP